MSDIPELVAWLCKASRAIYLATEKSVADDISPKLREAADALASLARERDDLTIYRELFEAMGRDMERNLVAINAAEARAEAAEQALAAMAVENERLTFDWSQEIDRFQAAQARAEQAEQALRPFAELADEIDKLGHEDNSTCLHRIKAADLRRALATLSSSGKAHGAIVPDDRVVSSADQIAAAGGTYGDHHE